jgi:hypothetical protein
VNYLLDRGFELDLEYVRGLFSEGAGMKEGRVVKNDLEEVAGSWEEKGFDLWEEV